MRGLSVRWSLAGLSPELAAQLRDYVAQGSHARFTGMAGLRFKVWRMRPGEWFEGCYVFATAAAREEFELAFRADADDSPVSRLVGAGPVLVEPYEVVAVAEGWEGFGSSLPD